MSVNHYLNLYNNKSEQNLMENLTIEAIKFYGQDVNYIPRSTIERDMIFGEDIRAQFTSNHLIEMYLESVDGWEGDGNILANFGMQIKDTATFILSKKRFQETIHEKIRPLEGDLIYMPMSNSLLEINFVEHENPFFQLGKLYTYKLTVEKFTYSHEDFDTGQSSIDRVNDDYSENNTIVISDNEDIQKESDEIVIENPNPKDDFLNIDDSDPFGGF